MVPVYYAICMGIALSACCGFRIFLPLLVAALAGHWGLIPLQHDMAWLGSWPAIICFGTATVLEIAAYYIPVVDNVLDALAAPLAVGAGTLAAVSLFPAGEWEPLWRWVLAALAGGTLAGGIQLGSGLLRLLSTKTTAGAGNAAVATGENVAALGGSVGAVFVPVLTALLLLLLAAWLFFRVLKRIFSRKKDK